jgi:hypothetical protein
MDDRLDVESSVEVLTTFEQIESVLECWERWQWHPEADPEFVRLIIESRAHAKAPCVIAVRRGHEVKALVVGRTEVSRLDDGYGWFSFLQPRLKVLRVLHGGLLGDLCEENIDAALIAMKNVLACGEWDVVQFRMLTLGSVLWKRRERVFPRSCRGSTDVPNPHWRLRVSGTYDEFVRSLDQKIRSNFNRQRRRLEQAYEDLSVARLHRPGDLQAIVTATDMVSERTYQRGFAPAWASDEMSKRLSLWLRRGAYDAYVVYVNGKACAYQHVLTYRGRAFAVGTGFDPAFREYGVGRYVQLRAMERVFDEAFAITELDFGFGDAQYKRELCRARDDEADLLLFALRPRALAANAIRTLELAAVRLAKQALRCAGQFSRAKARWRERRRNASRSHHTSS